MQNRLFMKATFFFLLPCIALQPDKTLSLQWFLQVKAKYAVMASLFCS